MCSLTNSDSFHLKFNHLFFFFFYVEKLVEPLIDIGREFQILGPQWSIVNCLRLEKDFFSSCHGRRTKEKFRVLMRNRTQTFGFRAPMLYH